LCTQSNIKGLCDSKLLLEIRVLSVLFAVHELLGSLLKAAIIVQRDGLGLSVGSACLCSSKKFQFDSMIQFFIIQPLALSPDNNNVIPKEQALTYTLMYQWFLDLQ
jgi:hypothetical protein